MSNPIDPNELVEFVRPEPLDTDLAQTLRADVLQPLTEEPAASGEHPYRVFHQPQDPMMESTIAALRALAMQMNASPSESRFRSMAGEILHTVHAHSVYRSYRDQVEEIVAPLQFGVTSTTMETVANQFLGVIETLFDSSMVQTVRVAVEQAGRQRVGFASQVAIGRTVMDPNIDLARLQMGQAVAEGLTRDIDRGMMQHLLERAQDAAVASGTTVTTAVQEPTEELTPASLERAMRRVAGGSGPADRVSVLSSPSPIRVELDPGVEAEVVRGVITACPSRPEFIGVPLARALGGMAGTLGQPNRNGDIFNFRRSASAPAAVLNHHSPYEPADRIAQAMRDSGDVSQELARRERVRASLAGLALRPASGLSAISAVAGDDEPVPQAQEITQEARTLATTILQMQGDAHTQALRALRDENPALHAAVRAAMRNLMEEVVQGRLGVRHGRGALGIRAGQGVTIQGSGNNIEVRAGDLVLNADGSPMGMVMSTSQDGGTIDLSIRSGVGGARPARQVRIPQMPALVLDVNVPKEGLRPIEGIPEGCRVRSRVRPGQPVKLYLRFTTHTQEHLILKRQDGTWFLGPMTAINGTPPPAPITEQPCEQGRRTLIATEP